MRTPSLKSILILCGLPAAILAFVFPHPQSDDDLLHHLMAHWSPEHPDLLVHIWGRAGFTILHAIPAQFGLRIDQLFSVFLTLLTGWFVARTLRAEGRTIAAMGAAFTILQTYFFQLSFGTMTETVFACALAGGMWAWREGRIVTAALLFSWTGITRLEGMPLLLLVGAGFLMHRRARGAAVGYGWIRTWIAFCLLGLWPILWNLALYAVSEWEQPLAIITSNTFVKSDRNAYGSGDWYKFLVLAPQIFTLPVLLCLLAGIRATWRAGHRTLVTYFAAFYALQSILWGFGLFRTAGYERFFASVAPLAGLLAGYGFPVLAGRLRGLRLMRSWSDGAIARGALGIAMTHCLIWVLGWQIVVKDNYEAIAEVTEAVRSLEPGLPGGPLLITNNIYPIHTLGIDPWDRTRRLRLDETADLDALPEGTVFVFGGGPFEEIDRLVSIYRRPQTSEVEERIAASAAVPYERPWYVHLLEGTRPQWREIARSGVLTRLLSDHPDEEPKPFWARAFVRTAEPAPTPR